MKNYVDYINESRINTTPTMMVYDSFRGHLEKLVKEKFNEYNKDLAVIPGG